MKSQELRPGMAVLMNGQVWLVSTREHVKPGKGPAYTQAKLKNIMTGAYQEKRFRNAEDVEQAFLDRRELVYLYTDGSGGVFMDNETFEQTTIGAELLGNALDFLIEDTTITGLVYNDNVVNIDLPQIVELKVKDTPPGIKDATKTNQVKEATCETGLKTRVPPFIETGEVIKVSTETGEYLGRA